MRGVHKKGSFKAMAFKIQAVCPPHPWASNVP